MRGGQVEEEAVVSYDLGQCVQDRRREEKSNLNDSAVIPSKIKHSILF